MTRQPRTKLDLLIMLADTKDALKRAFRATQAMEANGTLSQADRQEILARLDEALAVAAKWHA